MAADTAKVAAENVNKAPFSGPVLDHLKRIYDQLSHAEPRPVLDVDAHDAKAEGKKSADPLASLDDFLAYMNSPSAKADRDPGTPDLSAPISNYYVSSSHNTYLTGNQLSSDASAEAYTEVSERTALGGIEWLLTSSVSKRFSAAGADAWRSMFGMGFLPLMTRTTRTTTPAAPPAAVAAAAVAATIARKVLPVSRHFPRISGTLSDGRRPRRSLKMGLTSRRRRRKLRRHLSNHGCYMALL